jgi:nitrite reductase/ring-hydroxylating ferredoxin subunit
MTATHWVEALSLERLQADGPLAVKLGDRQLALFVLDGRVLACNNRCPHEGYPLCEGHLDGAGVLTCHWHNWKFDLRSGANLYGGDALRVYPARIDDGRVWVDLAEPDAAQRVAQWLDRLDEAMAEHDTPRIARELARLGLAGAAPELALMHALQRSHARLRYGMTHAYAAADAWFRLRDIVAQGDGDAASDNSAAMQLACATEALAHIAFDTLREPVFPYATGQQDWQPAGFLAAVEAQDEAAAQALLSGALAAGLSFDALEPTLAGAALAHYNDFGHALIYLTHVRGLIGRLGAAAAPSLLAAWTRALIFATREDLLPDFSAYSEALAAWPDAVAAGAADALPPAQAFTGLSVRRTLDATVDAAARHSPLALWQALLAAAAEHLLCFDERHATRSDNAVADNVGWLDFSHALTFGHALRQLAGREPTLWRPGLLQLAMFIGRNTRYLDAEVAPAAALAAWRVADPKAFDADVPRHIVDHGIGLPIFAAHRLKTWLAVRETLALGVSADTATLLRAALNRLLAARFKQRHSLRGARQALQFVGRE